MLPSNKQLRKANVGTKVRERVAASVSLEHALHICHCARMTQLI